MATVGEAIYLCADLPLGEGRADGKVRCRVLSHVSPPGDRDSDSIEPLANWLAEHFTQGLERWVHRHYGWSAIAVLGGYHTTANPYYLNAARLSCEYLIACSSGFRLNGSADTGDAVRIRYRVGGSAGEAQALVRVAETI